MTWQRLLAFLLWISPHALLVTVAILIYRRRLYREFPVFFIYTLFETLEFVLLYAIYSIRSVTGQQYYYVFVATMIVSIALRFGVIREVSEDLFREREFLRVTSKRSLQWTTVLLASLGIACVVLTPGEQGTRLMSGLAAVSRGVAIIQCGLLLFLLCFSRLFGLSWRSYAFGIAVGLGVLSSTELTTSAIRVYLTNQAWAITLDLLTMGSYMVCALIWFGYLLAPERKPSTVLNVPGDEIGEWNRELQRWLIP